MAVRRVQDLRPHPDNEAIYGDRADAGLVESVRQRGVLNPLLITADGRIVSGHRRWGAAQAAGLELVPVAFFGSEDELDIVEALIESNRQRDKTNEQMAREAKRLLEVMEERRKRLQQRNAERLNAERWGTESKGENFPASLPEGRARTLVAARFGVSDRTLEKAIEVVDVIDRLEGRGDAQQAEALRRTLNGKSTHAARAQAVNAGLIERAAPTPRTEPLPTIAARLEVADATRRWPVEDGSIDLVVTSPPYGLDKPYIDNLDEAHGWPVFMHDWLRQAFRAAKDGGRLAVNVPLDTTRGGNRPTYGQTIGAAMRQGWSYRWTIVWADNHLPKSVARGSVDSPGAPHVVAPVEMIAVFFKGEWRRAGERQPDIAHEDWLAWTNGLWTFVGEPIPWEGHPAPFPQDLPRRLIQLLSFPGDVVLDPFCGSGTTPLIAARLGREAVGFDSAPEYVASARRRLGIASPAEATG